MNPHYKEIKNAEDIRTFNRIWKEAWKEQGFKGEEIPHGFKYGILKDREIIGTIEVSVYKGMESLEKVYPFLKEKRVKENLGTVMLVDKVSFQSEHRGDRRNILRIAYLLYELYRKHKPTHYIAIMDPRFCDALKNLCRLAIEPLADGELFDGDYAIIGEATEASFDKYLQSSSYKKMQKEKIKHKK